MRNNFLRLGGLFAIVLFITSCSSKGPKEARYIPKDASVVLAVDPGLLQEKMKKGNIDIDTLFKQMLGKDSGNVKVKKMFEDFKNCGVDWNSKFYCFVTQKTDASKGQGTFVNLIGNLKDSSKLLSYLLTIDEFRGREIKNEKNYTYIQLDYNGMVAWTDKMILVTGYHYSPAISVMNMPDTVMRTYQAPSINKSEEIRKEVARFFTQKEDESMASVKAFTDMFKQKSDGYFLSTTNSTLNNLNKSMPLQLPKLEELLKDNYTVGTFNFADGKVEFNYSFYPNKILDGILKKYPGSAIKTAMFESYPSDKVDLLMTTSFNPEIIGGILKQLEVEALADGFLDKMGLSTKDIYKCLKGDIAVVVSDLQWPATAAQPGAKPQVVKMIFNAAIGDTASFAKLMDKAVENGFLYKGDHGYQSGYLMRSLGLYLHTDSKNIILASDSLTYVAYAANTAKLHLANGVMDEMKGKNAAMFVDLGNIFNGFSNMNDNAAMNTAKATFKDVIFTSENYNGTTTSASGTLRLKDEKQNSLVTLLKLIPEVSEQVRNSMPAGDSTSAGDGILSLPIFPRINNL
ncbi:MAG: DUF4836 family protein [Bacteroidota bacterium]|nr:DUF4836 family protein [Bacteroidota bacterium]